MLLTFEGGNENGHQNCPGGQPELRQDDHVQRPDGSEPVRGQLAGRHRGEKRRPAQRRGRCDHPGPAGHLQPFPLYAGGSGGARLSGQRKAGRHPQHRGRDEHRAQSLSDHAAGGAGHPHGHRPEHDRRHAQERRRHPTAQTGRGAGLRSGGDLGAQGHGQSGSGEKGRGTWQKGRPPRAAARIRRQRGARACAHRRPHHPQGRAGACASPSRGWEQTRGRHRRSASGALVRHQAL